MKCLLFVLLLLLTVSCNKFNKPETMVYTRSSLWIVDNLTEETITISWNFPEDSRHEEQVLSRELIIIGSLDSTIPYVNPDFTEIQKLAGKEEMTVSACSKESVFLNTWRLSERNSPGRQFFDELLWEKTENAYYLKMTDVVWHFKIMPEDIGM